MIGKFIRSALILASAIFPTASYAFDLGPVTVHGGMDMNALNADINPRGGVAFNKGVNSQAVNSLIVTLYTGTGFVKDFSLVGVTFNDIQSKWAGSGFTHNAQYGPWFEIDWYTGLNAHLGDHWMVDFGGGQWISPADYFGTSDVLSGSITYQGINIAPRTTLNPYIFGLYNNAGAPGVPVGRAESGYAEIGVKPTIDLSNFTVPMKLVMPTLIQVGPTSFWGDGSPEYANIPGPRFKNGNNLGVFSVGIQAAVPLPALTWGDLRWHLDAGVTYDHIFNDRLLLIQYVARTTGAGRNPVYGNIGLGFTF